MVMNLSWDEIRVEALEAYMSDVLDEVNTMCRTVGLLLDYDIERRGHSVELNVEVYERSGKYFVDLDGMASEDGSLVDVQLIAKSQHIESHDVRKEVWRFRFRGSDLVRDSAGVVYERVMEAMEGIGFDV